MNYKRFGSAIAAAIASAVGWSLMSSIQPTQAETSDSPSVEISAESTASSEDESPSNKTNVSAAKVGEPSSQQIKAKRAQDTTAIAKVFPHRINDRQAATVYVRNIPVLTFLGESAATSSEQSPEPEKASPDLRKLANTKADTLTPKHPLWKANQLVAEFNQLSQSNSVKAGKISVRWKDNRYLIEHDGVELITVDENVILPDTTGTAAQDALQATNRLRRLLGPEEAAALAKVADLPAPPKPAPQQVAYNSSFYEQGMASWYGPGFHGRTSANGETFNQYAMTAAHKYLPFNTRVKVTNLNNGASVQVRINDRGPYAHGRVIDLSAAAADYIGLSSAGVAPVKIEVIR